jgi:hypothetical protein
MANCARASHSNHGNVVDDQPQCGNHPKGIREDQRQTFTHGQVDGREVFPEAECEVAEEREQLKKLLMIEM